MTHVSDETTTQATGGRGKEVEPRDLPEDSSPPPARPTAVPIGRPVSPAHFEKMKKNAEKKKGPRRGGQLDPTAGPDVMTDKENDDAHED